MESTGLEQPDEDESRSRPTLNSAQLIIAVAFAEAPELFTATPDHRGKLLVRCPLPRIEKASGDSEPRCTKTKLGT